MLTKNNQSALIIILSAPSGGGKSSIAKEIIKRDKNIILSISATTRPARPEEIENQHYFFKTLEEFNFSKKKNEFLETAQIYDNYYGTPKNFILETLEKNIDILFDIEYNGAAQIKKSMPKQTISIFIAPPSIDILKERLVARNQDHPDIIEKRIKLAQDEMQHADKYDYLVINDKFEQAILEIQEIIKKERLNKRINEI